MVLEGLAALGLASNILQLIEFSYKLVSGAKEISNSTTGVSAQHETFETVSQSLIQLVNNLDGTSSSRIPPETRKLAAQTKELAKSFLTKLDELKPKGPKRPWSGFIQAMKEADQSDRLLALNRRLNMLQRSLNGHLLNIMGQQLEEINEMVNEDRRLQLQTTLEVQRLRNDIMSELRNLTGQGQLGNVNVADYLKSLEDPIALGIEDTREEIQKAEAKKIRGKQKRSKRIGQKDVELLSKMFARLSESTRLFPTEASMTWTRYSLLKSLSYAGMRDRQQVVPSAHSETLNWIFDGSVPENYRGPSPGFVEWLEHEDGIFWVHGKPGSGKSTLMKFFANHPTTATLLKKWADHDRKRLVFASHFFWIAGGKLQRSQRGLLRTLLFNIIRDCPGLVTCIYPDQEAIHYPSDNEEWSFQELNEAFSRLKSQTEVRICLFIDGLDEYDPDTHEGSYQELIKTLVSISESPSIKICISSRSWYVFKDAFEKDEDGEVSKRAVALQDLNRPDIEAYVHSSFSKNKRFRNLSQSEPRYHALLDQIVQKSQGVFLWVFLVVRSLLNGLTFADRISDLQKRLDQIPDDLNDYFEQILDSVDNFYLKETAEVFQIMLQSEVEVPLLAISFLFEEDDDYAFKIQGWCPMESQEVFRRSDETRRRLDGRCRGLVETDTRPGFSVYQCKVRFLHRTVRDFLQNKAMEKLFEKLGSQFDANISAAKSYLALIKRIPPSEYSRLDQETDEEMYSALLSHCGKYDVHTSKVLMDILNEATAVFKLRTIEFSGHKTLLEYASKEKLWLFLLQVIDTGPMITTKEREFLLYDALRSWSYKDPKMQLFWKDLIKCLLQKGSSPNRRFRKSKTAWEVYLHHLQDPMSGNATNKSDLFEVGRNLIIHGAHSLTKNEVKIILRAEHILPIEQRKELVGLLRWRRFNPLILIKRGSKSVWKLVGEACGS